MMPDPLTPNGTIYDRWKGSYGRLGSGSDYTVFLEHLGIPSLDIGFSGDYGVYHSIFDSFAYISNISDPEFVYHRVASQIWGLLAIRLADSTILPFDYSNYASELQIYLEEITQYLSSNGGSIPLNDLRSAVTVFVDGANKAAQDLKNLQLSTDQINKYNDRLTMTERAFLDPNGLPGRQWFKHVIYAPGKYLGYGAVIFPGLYEAITDKDWTLAAEQQSSIAAKVTNAGNVLSASRNTKTPIILGVIILILILCIVTVIIVNYYYQRRYTAVYTNVF